ncbi:MAG TPA: beta-propeller fold lactonase family protein [Chlamydiales bacterium]|nr:beta-propeller fold lactonase family protein [Chlamydiales bacterium]
MKSLRVLFFTTSAISATFLSQIEGTTTYTVYVSNTHTNDITYFPSNDVTDLNLITSLPLNSPFCMAIAPRGDIAYLANESNNNVIKFFLDNPSDYEIITGSFSSPTGIAITPDGTTAYVTNPANGTITSFPLSNPSDQTVISGLINPAGITISPNGQTAYVANGTGDNIISFPLANPSDQSVVPVTFPSGFGTEGPAGILISPDGSTLFVSPNSCDATVFIYFPIANPSDVTTITPSPYHPAGFFGLSPDGQTVYLGIGSGLCVVGEDIIRFPLNDPTLIEAISGFSAPTGIVTSPSALPPQNLSGKQKRNRFAFESELYNVLKWTDSFGIATAAYNVYRDGTLIATVPITASLRVEDHNRIPDVSYQYKVVSVNIQGIEGAFETITIP